MFRKNIARSLVAGAAMALGMGAAQMPQSLGQPPRVETIRRGTKRFGGRRSDWTVAADKRRALKARNRKRAKR